MNWMIYAGDRLDVAKRTRENVVLHKEAELVPIITTTHVSETWRNSLLGFLETCAAK